MTEVEELERESKNFVLLNRKFLQLSSPLQLAVKKELLSSVSVNYMKLYHVKVYNSPTYDLTCRFGCLQCQICLGPICILRNITEAEEEIALGKVRSTLFSIPGKVCQHFKTKGCRMKQPPGFTIPKQKRTFTPPSKARRSQRHQNNKATPKNCRKVNVVWPFSSFVYI